MSEPFVGEIRMFGGGFAPRGWALCDGQLLNVSDNEALFSLLGACYGGDGRTTFALPDMRGRLPVHMGSGPGLTPRQIGQRTGVEEVTVTTNQIPSHNHLLMAEQGEADCTALNGKVLAKNPGADTFYAPLSSDPDLNPTLRPDILGDAGNGQPHTNEMPYLCVNFIIALIGVYPSRS
ncbi:MAG: phage tail protein [Desulfobacterales bacterium]|nr:phage tail protein [Desulfobacterales bacterium]